MRMIVSSSGIIGKRELLDFFVKELPVVVGIHFD